MTRMKEVDDEDDNVEGRVDGDLARGMQNFFQKARLYQTQ